MKRHVVLSALTAAAIVCAAVVHADVKTTEKTQIKFEGMMGRMFNMFGGSAAKEGVTATVALKGSRLSRMSDTTGQIIDLSEQKIYDVDLKKKEYRVTTFEEMRQRIREQREKAAKQAKDMSAEDKQNLDNAGKQIEIDFDVKETGQHKQIAGHNTREVVMTISAREKGKKIEDSGGFVMTTNLWLAPKIAALDEIGAFEQKYFQSVYGEALGINPENMAALMAMYPSFAKMAARMQTEGKKLEGTALLTTTTFEAVKSAEAMKEGSSQSSGGGGIAGRLAGRLALRGPVEHKATVMTTTNERLSVQPTASAEDVAIPAGFKEKK
jgi:hypothetical protein